MSEQRLTSFSVPNDQPLIGVIVREDNEELTRYFTDEQAADAAVQPTATQEALNAIGAWSDLDWDEMEQALDRIRHESPPSLPIADV